MKPTLRSVIVAGFLLVLASWPVLSQFPLQPGQPVPPLMPRLGVAPQGLPMVAPVIDQGPPRIAPQNPWADWEVRFTDDSTMKVGLLDDHLTLATDYGPLHIPFGDVRRIEFGQRTDAAIQASIDKAVGELRDGDSAVREKAKAALVDLGPAALPAVRRALKTVTVEERPHVEQVAAKLQSLLTDPKAEPRDYDVIVTVDSRFTGRIQAPMIRIRTYQFGELKMKLTDATVMVKGAIVADVKFEAVPGRTVYPYLQTHMGKVLGLTLTGQAQGAVWGTGPFTGDSDVAAAAMYAGVLKPGQTAVVKVRIVASPAQFGAGTANGVTTNAYGGFPQGAFEIVK